MTSFKDLLKWYFSRRALPYWSILLLDSAFVLFSGLLAYTVHHGADQTSEVFVPLVWTLGIFLICFVVAFRIFHTYDGVIRFSSFRDLMRVTFAVVSAIILVFILDWILGGATWLLTFTTADIILFGLFVVAFMWTIRVWVKTLYEESLRRSNREPAFILGVKTGGAALAKNMNSSEDSPYKVAGFVDNEKDMANRFLMGEKVYNFDEKLSDAMQKAGAKALIVSPLMMKGLQENPTIVDGLVENGIKIMGRSQHIRAAIRKTPASLRITMHGSSARKLMPDAETKHLNIIPRLLLHLLKKRLISTRRSRMYMVR